MKGERKVECAKDSREYLARRKMAKEQLLAWPKGGSFRLRTGGDGPVSRQSPEGGGPVALEGGGEVRGLVESVDWAREFPGVPSPPRPGGYNCAGDCTSGPDQRVYARRLTKTRWRLQDHRSGYREGRRGGRRVDKSLLSEWRSPSALSLPCSECGHQTENSAYQARD